ncbi:MAG TPA: hypothetical protein PLH22_02770 [Candidatus Colwellbacteria bacterium]|nr:hypothetical protein [Candidatus Colwellbacteria bacterium]
MKTKKVYTFVIISAMVIVVIAVVFVYNLKNEQGLFFQPESQNQMGPNETNEEDNLPPKNSVEFQGKTLMADINFPIGVIDGIIEDASDISGQTLVLRVDVFKIYPETPLNSKLVKISFEDAEIFFADSGRNATPDNMNNIKTGMAISVGLADGETNRDILFKDEFKAIKITFFTK